MQLAFPFAWEPSEHVEMADKVMPVSGRTRTRRRVHRNSRHGCWVVSEYAPVYGPSGRVGVSIFYVFPRVFFAGRDAWDFAKCTTTPFLDCTLT